MLTPVVPFRPRVQASRRGNGQENHTNNITATTTTTTTTTTNNNNNNNDNCQPSKPPVSGLEDGGVHGDGHLAGGL